MPFLFDNNFSHHIPTNLGDDCVHIRDVYGSDAQDVDFIPKMAGGDFVLVTKDTSMRRKPLEKQALEDAQLTVVFLHRRFFDQRAAEQLEWFMIKWPILRSQIAKHPKGTHLKLTTDGGLSVWPYANESAKKRVEGT
jgi:hypothetical protein